MSVNDTNRNGSMPTTVEESTEPVMCHRESALRNCVIETNAAFHRRTDRFKRFLAPNHDARD